MVTCACRCVGSGGDRVLLEEECWAGNGGGVSGVACGLVCGSKRSGGCPGRDLCSMGTLVVRMIGSSLLVDDKAEGGGRGGGGLLPAGVGVKL